MNSSNNGFTLVKRQICVGLLFAAFTVGMRVQAADVSDFTQLQSALSSGATEINLKASIDATANLKNTSALSLTINGSGFHLDGKGNYSGIQSSAKALYINDNITFKNFKNYMGAAIYTRSNNSEAITIGDKVAFYNNSADYYGGAIFNDSSYNGSSGIAKIKIGDGNVFSYNTAGYMGGAIYNLSTTLGAAVTIEIGDNAVFDNNSVDYYGGAIYNNSDNSGDAKLTIGDKAVFSNNSAGNNGGAIYNYNSGSDAATIEIGDNAVFDNNSASSYTGGAIYNLSKSGISKIEIGDNAQFSNNTSGTTFVGGAIYNGTSSGSAAEITIGDHARFYNNQAPIYSSSGGTSKLTIGEDAVFSNNYYYTAIQQNASSAEMIIGDHARFFENSARSISNGGVTSAVLTIGDDAQFFDNTAGLTSGAIANSSNSGDATIKVGNDAVFHNNDGTVSGMAIYNNGVTAKIEVGENAVFSDNYTTNDRGGAIFNGGSSEAQLTIGDNARFSDNSAGNNGGAVYNYSNSGTTELTIGADTVFSGNYTKNYGGAIYSFGYSASQLTIGDNAQFSDNYTTSGNGGAIYSQSTSASQITAGDNTAFSNNSCGAVFNYSTSGTTELTIGANAQFSDNYTTSGYGGGAIYNRGVTGSQLTIGDNARFSDNYTTSGNGGAVYNYISSNGTTAITIGDRAVFSDNYTTNGRGGAIFNYSYDGTAQLTIGDNTVFSGNSAGTLGGAIYNFDYSASQLTIGDNARFSNNTAVSYGGAIYNESYDASSTGTIDITGTAIFTGNTANSNPSDIYMGGSGTHTLNISGDSGTVYFDGGIASSNANATINKSGKGTLIFAERAVNTGYTGTFEQTAGTTTVYGQFFNNALANNISNSNLNLFQTTQTIGINNLNLNNANVNSINNVINTFNIGTFSAAGTNNFSVDIDGLAGTSDTFNITSASGTGTLNIANFHLVNAPTAESIPLTIFSGNISGYTFTTSKTEVTTPVYNYKFRSDGGGTYSLLRGNFNTEVFRGQAAKLAVYQNQLIVNNTLFDHVYLDSNERTAMANKYAAGTEMFAPYQFTKKDGAIWTKTYATFERLSMTHGLNVANNAYGQIIGADFPVVELSKGWKFLPTAYISYNGGHQTFNGVSMYQNGGQGGFMGTFNKGDFIGSVLAYGGGYNNEMSVAGNTENTGNWFAGTAVKGAYNIHATRNFIIQPNLLASYNIFGKQNWYSNYGALSMNSGLLNGINVAPGLNLIYGRETWSVYLTALYMYNINDSVGGRAGSVNLPGLSMRHGYLEYGVGATKTWKDRLSSYVQFVIRNGGRTGVGFQLGLTWKF